MRYKINHILVTKATTICHVGAETYTVNRKRFLDSMTAGTENLLKARNMK